MNASANATGTWTVSEAGVPSLPCFCLVLLTIRSEAVYILPEGTVSVPSIEIGQYSKLGLVVIDSSTGVAVDIIGNIGVHLLELV